MSGFQRATTVGDRSRADSKQLPEIAADDSGNMKNDPEKLAPS